MHSNFCVMCKVCNYYCCFIIKLISYQISTVLIIHLYFIVTVITIKKKIILVKFYTSNKTPFCIINNTNVTNFAIPVHSLNQRDVGSSKQLASANVLICMLESFSKQCIISWQPSIIQHLAIAYKNHRVSHQKATTYGVNVTQ